MKWLIPAKTFLVGEYSAIAEGSAIILTTTPCFELSLINHLGTSGINSQSPAGLYWKQQDVANQGLLWSDPYQGQGGLGASSGQFLACFLASCALRKYTPNIEELLDAYYQNAWSGKGLKPSGYDVLAQSQSGCVFINKSRQSIHSYPWAFKELSFILLHTGTKLATHEHLQDSSLPEGIERFSKIADLARQAFIQTDSELLIQAINAYHQQLLLANRVAQHSLELINEIETYPEVLAIKGCGALAADVLLIICTKTNKAPLLEKINAKQWTLLATEDNVYKSRQESLLKMHLVRDKKCH